MTQDLDAQVATFRSRPPLYVGPYTFMAADDALVLKVREGGRNGEPISHAKQ